MTKDVKVNETVCERTVQQNVLEVRVYGVGIIHPLRMYVVDKEVVRVGLLEEKVQKENNDGIYVV